MVINKETKWRQKWRQNGDKMETKWRQNGDKMETKWRLNGVNFESTWRQMETKWRQIGDRSLGGEGQNKWHAGPGSCTRSDYRAVLLTISLALCCSLCW